MSRSVTPWDQDAKDPRLAEHYLEQLKGSVRQVAFLEKQTGKSWIWIACGDHAILQEALRYWYQVLQLRKAIPSPMGATDYFSAIIPQMYMLGEPEAVNFYREM